MRCQQSDTIRIATRKIKAFPMNLKAQIGFIVTDLDENMPKRVFHYDFINDLSITDLLM
jgi:hypothetical protein